MVSKKSKAAGSFLGGISNNPGVVAIVVILGAILLFRGDIRGAFASVGESISGIGSGGVNVNLPSINLPSINLPEFNFPSLPEFNFPSLPEFNFPSLPEFNFPSLPDINISNIFGGDGGSQPSIIDDPAETARLVENVEPPIQVVQPEGSSVVISEGLGTVFRGGTEILGPQGEVIPEDRPLNIAQLLNNIGEGQPASIMPIAESVVQSEIEGQQFLGSGPNFIGGVVREIPIERMSIGDIAERFDVSASQAADLLFRATGGDVDFDFGTNTGSGIGSVFPTPEIITELPNLGQVSDPQFQGLSAEDIALQITGNIQNF